MAAKITLPPPPNSEDLTSQAWRDWFYKLASIVSQLNGQAGTPGSTGASHGTIPVFIGDGGADERGSPEDYSIPGPRGIPGPQGERGPALFLGDHLEEVETYPAPWEGVRSSAQFQGIVTENGVVDRSQSTLSFVNGTRTFTISPTGAGFELWSYGNRIFKTSPDSVVIPNTEGQWAIYYDAFGVLTAQLGFDSTLITQKGWVSLLYWDATNGQSIILTDERHGRVMDSETHSYLHSTRHTVYQSGLDILGISADGSGNLATDAEFSCSGGIIWDEDIDLHIVDGVPQTLSPIARIPLYYRSGAAGNWRRIAPTNFPVSAGAPGPGARANWNQLTGGAWQLTELTNLDCVNMHYFATNSVGADQIIGIIGQTDWDTVAHAQAGALTEIFTLITTGLPSLEWVPIGTVIFQSGNAYGNAVKSRIRSTAAGGTYVDWRMPPGEPTAGSGGSSSSPVTWGTITGTLSSQTDLQAALDAKVSRSQIPVPQLEDNEEGEKFLFPGPPGPQGPQGAQGPAGSGTGGGSPLLSFEPLSDEGELSLSTPPGGTAKGGTPAVGYWVLPFAAAHG